MSLTESSQKHYIDWIFEAKQLETKVNRMAKTIERLEKGLKMYDNNKDEIPSVFQQNKSLYRLFEAY